MTESETPESLPFMVDYAKSHRSSCKQCSNHIIKESLRMGVVLPRYDYKVANWYHPDCFWECARVKSKADIHDFDLLTSADQEMIEDKIKALGHRISGLLKKPALEDFFLEYASSSRATCKTCGRKISCGFVRVGRYEYDSVLSRCMVKGGVVCWYHAICFIRQREELEFYESGDKIRGYDMLTDEEKRALVRRLPPLRNHTMPRALPPPPKAKRGRKPKQRPAAQLNGGGGVGPAPRPSPLPQQQQQVAGSSSNPPVVRRGRGRPRKNPPVMVLDLDQTLKAEISECVESMLGELSQLSDWTENCEEAVAPPTNEDAANEIEDKSLAPPSDTNLANENEAKSLAAPSDTNLANEHGAIDTTATPMDESLANEKEIMTSDKNGANQMMDTETSRENRACLLDENNETSANQIIYADASAENEAISLDENTTKQEKESETSAENPASVLIAENGTNPKMESENGACLLDDNATNETIDTLDQSGAVDKSEQPADPLECASTKPNCSFSESLYPIPSEECLAAATAFLREPDRACAVDQMDFGPMAALIDNGPATVATFSAPFSSDACSDKPPLKKMKSY